MNQHNPADKNKPLHIHLGDDDEDEYDAQEDAGLHEDAEPHDDAEFSDDDGAHDDDELHDDDGVEVIRPQGRRADSSSTRGRGLRNLPVEDEEEELPPSKTKIKKQMHELRDLGKELTELGKDQLAQLDIPENLRDAIREMHRINSFGAQRRQIQYIGKLMRDVDPAPIIARLDAWKGKSQSHTVYMHQLERWRERLLENDKALTELLAAYPQIDVQRLRTLIRNAQKEREAAKPPKNFREIFQVLRDIIPEPGKSQAE
ncbi:MAG TPA: ribosome biogenesis factor YjgA [Gallionella sp.]|nr:ribosome biogenesis factor YjgA [Gallionella sp.]